MNKERIGLWIAALTGAINAIWELVKGLIQRAAFCV